MILHKKWWQSGTVVGGFFNLILFLFPVFVPWRGPRLHESLQKNTLSGTRRGIVTLSRWIPILPHQEWKRRAASPAPILCPLPADSLQSFHSIPTAASLFGKWVAPGEPQDTATCLQQIDSVSRYLQLPLPSQHRGFFDLLLSQCRCSRHHLHHRGADLIRTCSEQRLTVPCFAFHSAPRYQERISQCISIKPWEAR